MSHQQTQLSEARNIMNEPVWEHFVEGVNGGGDYPVAANVEYTILNDGGELVAEILAVYVDEWVTPYSWLVEQIIEHFYDDWHRGRIHLVL